MVIPNWNGAVRLERVLESLRWQTERACEVLVVDNASSDSSKQSADAHAVTWIPLDRNYGFARAVNTGIKQAAGDAVAILNNDVTFGSRFPFAPFWARSASTISRRRKIVMASDPARLDGTFDLTNRGFCSWRAGHGLSASAAIWNQPREIASAPMTAVLFRKSVFDRVGLLDEQFGSYLEDVDYGLRCALQGIRGYYEPSAVVSHEGSATLGGEWNPGSTRWIARNQVILARKYSGRLIWFSWPVFGRSIAMDLAAVLKRGQIRSWIQGKIEGCRAEVNPLASQSFENENGELNQILRSQEQETRRLLTESGADQRYWRAYSALTGGTD